MSKGGNLIRPQERCTGQGKALSLMGFAGTEQAWEPAWGLLLRVAGGGESRGG